MTEVASDKLNPIELLTFTTLYPNAAQPRHGLFVEQRLRHLLATGGVTSRVIAPVPWFPMRSKRFGKYAAYAAAPYAEERYGVEITHPRYPVFPRIGMAGAPLLMAAAVAREFRRVKSNGRRFRAIDAHYFYPDGVAAAIIGRWLKIPVVITARGTDINLIPQFPLPRKQIQWAASRSAAIITVCQALKDEIVSLGISDSHVTVLPNGVDLEMFRPVERAIARKELGFSRHTLISIGHLIERKGHHIAIEAVKQLPDVELVIVGEGEMERGLRRTASSLGVADRVRFEGAVPQERLRNYYSAADALVLASSREGIANVILESLACGNPVIANPAWGTPEVIRDPSIGILMRRRDPAALVDAYEQLMRRYPDRAAIRRFAERFSWEATTSGQLEIFSSIT